MNYPIDLRGQLLARLMPGGDFTVYAKRGYEIEWRDARPQPSEADLEAEFLKLEQEKADSATKRTTRRGVRAALILKIKAGTNLTNAEVQDFIRIVAAELWGAD